MRIRTTASVLGLCALVLAGCGTGDTTPAASSASANTTIAGVGTVSASSTLAETVPESLRSTGLRVVVSAPYPPFEQFDAQNQLEGVDVDLAHAIGAKLGVSTALTNVDFSGVVPALQARRADIAMAGMQDNAERQQVLNFVDYSTDSGAQLVVAHDNPGSIATFTDLCGKAVGFETGSTYEGTLEHNQILCQRAGRPAVQAVAQASQGAAVLALQSGAVSALLTSGISASMLEAAQPDAVRVLQDPQAPDGFFTSDDHSPTLAGIGVVKSDSELFNAVFGAMDELGKDGTTKKIFAKWGVDGHALVPPTRNAGK